MLKNNQQILDTIRSFRPHFTPSIFTATLGTALLTGIYRGGLLSRILMQKPRYLVESERDLVQLAGAVSMYTSLSAQTWQEVQYCINALL